MADNTGIEWTDATWLMRRLLVILAVAAVVVYVAPARAPLAVVPPRVRLLVPAALLGLAPDELLPLPPYRGASRDRSLPGKARRRARRAA